MDPSLSICCKPGGPLLITAIGDERYTSNLAAAPQLTGVELIRAECAALVVENDGRWYCCSLQWYGWHAVPAAVGKHYIGFLLPKVHNDCDVDYLVLGAHADAYRAWQSREAARTALEVVTPCPN